MTIHKRRLKTITLDLGGLSFECQVDNWMLNNNTDDGDKVYTFCPEGEDREEVDPDWSLSLSFFADWRSNGLSDWLQLNDGATTTFQVDHHADLPGEHVRYTGELIVKTPNVGGDARATEKQEIELMVIGKPTYVRI